MIKQISIKIIIFLLTFCFIQTSFIFAEDKQLRIISLAPSTTEILFALGLDEEIVGVSSYCNYPPKAKEKTKVGDFSHPNLEKIFSLKPDYIFATGLAQAQIVTRLRNLNFKVYVADPKNIEELFKSISDIAQLTHKTQEGSQLIKKMKNDIAGITAKTQAIPPDKKVKVFIEIWYDPLMTAGQDSFIDELITLAGGINIAHNLRRPYSNFSTEEIIRINPDCIIMTYMDKKEPLELVTARFGWENINAVKNKRVFNDIKPDILLRPGPRITEGLKEIYKRLYPQE